MADQAQAKKLEKTDDKAKTSTEAINAVFTNPPAEEEKEKRQTVTLVDFAQADILAKLNKASELKDTDFIEEVSDFWKPTQANEMKEGVYRGGAYDGKYFFHSLDIKHPKTGQPFTIRVPGTRSLNKLLELGSPGRYCRIIFLGKTVTGNARNFNNWKVLWAK